MPHDVPHSQCKPRCPAFVRYGVFLLASGLLLPACTDNPGTDNPVRPLNELPTEQLRTFLKGVPGDWRNDSDHSKGVPQPPAEKPVPPDAKRIDLVPPAQLRDIGGDLSVPDAIASRRSRREFSHAPLSLKELSYLLWATQGITGKGQEDPAVNFRAAPSGGGRYPIETYLALNRVDGIAPGLYRYLPVDHQLVLVRESPDIASEIQAACFGQPIYAHAAAVFIWAAVPYRTEWKYAYIAHRMIAMEAGHICQNLYLAAESARLATSALLGYHQPSLDTLLGLDGTDEFTVYTACVGRRK